MQVGFLAIGNELLSGHTLDTNTQWGSLQLGAAGFEVNEKLTVGDDAAAITSALGFLLNRTDLVITSGGIGPTKDDITKSTLNDFFVGELVLNQIILDDILARFHERGIQMNPLTEGQARVPSSAEAIINPVGTAPVLLFQRDGQMVITLPGVPSEFRHLLAEIIIPRLKRQFPSEYVGFREVHTAGVAESALAVRLGGIEAKISDGDKLMAVSLAYLPSRGQVTLRVTGRGADQKQVDSTLDSLAAEMLEICGDDAYGTGDFSLPQAIGQLLSDGGCTIATAESCTAGGVGAALTTANGSSRWFLGGLITYHSGMKVKLLGVEEDAIEKFTTVSREVACQMAEGALQRTGADYAISTTGVAGPGPDEFGNPVGKIWVGIAKRGEPTMAKQYKFYKERQANIEMFVLIALDQLRRRLLADLKGNGGNLAAE